MNRKSLSLTIVAAALGMAAGCSREPVAQELIGSWATDVPAYKDRGFRITEDSLFLQTNAAVTEPYRIKTISSHEESGRVRYDMKYENVLRAYDMRIYYYPTEGVVRMANRENMIWKKKTS